MSSSTTPVAKGASNTPASKGTSTPASKGASTPTAKTGTNIVPRDAEFMFRVVQNMKGKPSDVNWEKVAMDMGYKNAAVASTRFTQIKKKMETSFDTATASASGMDTTPSKAPKVKANKVVKAGVKPSTPRKGVASPVKKKAVKSAEKVAKEDDGGIDDDGEASLDEKVEKAEKAENSKNSETKGFKFELDDNEDDEDDDE